MKRKALFTFLIIVLLYAPVVAAETVRFAYPAKSLNYLPLFLGKHKGIPQAEGVDLDLIQVASMISAKALMTGDLDFSGAQAQVIAAAARGIPVKVVGFITVKPSFWLMSKPEVRSIADLKGKIIGTTAIGSSTDTLARYLVKKHGLAPDKEVALFATGTTANILAAMKVGSVDAGILSPPFHAMAKLMGFRVLAYLGDHVEQSLSGIGTSERLLREKSETVRKVLRATLKGLRFIRENREESVAYIVKEWKVERPLAEELYLSMLQAFSPDGGMGEKGIRDTLEREREKLEIREEIPLARVIDLRPLREVQKELR
jgi:NitT/TauT family transport system substrate-binding protein